MAPVSLGGMYRKLGWGESENQPSSARVNGRQAEHILEELTDLRGVG